MKDLWKGVAVAIVLGASLTLSAQPQTPELRLKAAMKLETVDGDLPAAIREYKDIISKHAKNREVVAKALLQLAGCYEKLGDRQARQSYERILREFADINDVAATAKTKLAGLRREGAAPFVQRTLDSDLMYGSPDGRLVIYHKGDAFGRVYIRDLGGGPERILFDLEGTASNFAWSPDSRHLALDYQNAAKKIRETRIVTVATGQMRSLPVRHGYPFGYTTTGDVFFYRPNYATNTIDYTLASADTGVVRKQFPQPVSEGCCPLVTPDGKRIVAPKGKRLAVIDIDTGASRPLTDGTSEEISPVMSADGRLISFVSNRDGKWGRYVAPLDRATVAEPVRLGFVDEAAIAGRRGQRYDWWTSGGMLTVSMPYTETNIVRLAMNPESGRAMGQPQRLTQDAPRNFGAAISPDGTHIAYQYRNASKMGVAVMDAGGISERPLFEQTGNLPVQWRSADEILFYDFSTEAGQRPAITSYNVKTGLKVPIARVAGLYWGYSPARNEILHSHPGGGGPKRGNQIKAWSISDNRDREVATIDFLVPWWSVSPDGRRIAFGTARNIDAPPVQCELALMSIDGVRERTLMQNSPLCGNAAAWSPTGRFLVVNSDAKGPHVVNIETGEAWPLHASMSDKTWQAGSWSPDGTFIVVTHGSSRFERVAWDGVTYEAVTRLLARSARR